MLDIVQGQTKPNVTVQCIDESNPTIVCTDQNGTELSKKTAYVSIDFVHWVQSKEKVEKLRTKKCPLFTSKVLKTLFEMN